MAERHIVEAHLQQAERHVVQGKMSLAKQRTIVEELDRDGHDTTEAVKLLRQFEDLQSLHIADRDRLARELSELDRA